MMTITLTHRKDPVTALKEDRSRHAGRYASLLGLLLLSASLSFGANHYILPSGSGAKTGADWNNACAGFSGGTASACAPSSMVRGDTYYVGGGAYSLPVWNTKESGTSVVTIKGATAADHGTAAGWTSPYGVDVNQATFSTRGTYAPVGLFIWNGYVVFDGNTGTPAAGPASYGFAVALPSSCSGGNTPIEVGSGGSSIDDVQISHFYFKACSGDVQTEGIVLQGTTTANNFIYSYNYFNGFQTAIQDSSTGLTFDHNYLLNAYSSPNHHGNQLDFIDHEVNPVISNNQILSCAGTVCMGANDNGNTCSQGVTGAKIYGNVFNAILTSGGTQAVGDGIIGATTRCFIKNTAVYNNTFSGSATGWFQGCVTGAATCSSATGNVAENNIIWNGSCALGAGVDVIDYNSYLSCTDVAPTESHGQVASLNPFVNTGTNKYLPLAATVPSCSSTAATCTGLNLSTSYLTDPNGVSRSADGMWQRGAYQHEPATSAPLPPSNLAAQAQ